MDFRFNAHDPRTGEFLFAMPRPSKAQIGDVFGERGTLELTYSALQARALDLPTFVAVRMQVQFDGGEWADVGPELVRLGGSHEDTDQAGMRDVTFVGREWLLNRARVSAGDTSVELIDGKRPFYQATPGEIMQTLLLEAKDRGAASGIDLGGFTASADSAGNAWSERVTIYYSPGLPIGDVLVNLVDQGLCDYRMVGRSLELYVPETTLGRDLTTGTNPVRVHGAVTQAPVQYTLEDIANSALLIGEDGFQVEVDNPSAPDDYGRLEVTIEQGGVNQEGTARTLIDAELQRGSREIREITRTQHAAGAKALPYRDYRCGDYVQAYDQGEWQRYRVREIQLVLDANGWTIHTVLNDRLQELLLRLAKKTNGIVNGSRGSGGDGTRPAPPPKLGVEPAAPEGLVIDQQVYLDDGGTARGVVTAGWGAVTESTRGLGIDIGGYELWWRENETFAVWQRATATSGDTEVSHSPVVLTAPDGSAMEYQWRVRAIAQESNRPGLWSNTVTLTMTQDTTPPPPPSAPIVSTGFRIVTVEWDGLDQDGLPMPRDFAWTRIYTAATENMAGAQRVGSLGHPGSWNSETMPADVPVWVAMTAVDRVGNESPMTAAVSVTPQALVDEDAIQDAIDNAKVGAIEEAVTTAGGRRVHNKTTTPVNAPTDTEYDVWQQWTTLEEGATLVAAWMHDGNTWVKRDITEEYVPRIHIGEGTFGVMSGQRLEVGSVAADKVLIGRATNILTNPNFVKGASGWTNPGNAAVSVGTGRNGTNRWTLLGTSSQSISYLGYDPADAGYRVPVREGDRYRASVWVQSGATIPAAGVGLMFRGWTGSGMVWMTPGIVRNTTPISANLSVWTEHAAEFIVPAGVTHLVFGLENAAAFTGYIRFSDPAVTPMVGATIIEDGAITTPKIAALAIEAGHLQANAVEADTIAAGAIDGKLITGATVRTAASGSRVQMNTQGLYAYAPDGEQTLGVSAITGAISLTGNVTQRNAYGRAVFGPELFTGTSGIGPAVSFPVTGTTYSGQGGIYARAADSDGKPELHLQGPHAGSDQGSILDLAAGDSAESTLLRRNYGSGASAGVSLDSDGNTHVQSRGDLYLRARTTSDSYSPAYVTIGNSGSITLRTQQTSNENVRGGYIDLSTNGVVVTAGNGASGVAARDLYLSAYGTARFQAFATGSSGTAQSYIRAEPNGELTMAGAGGNSYFRVRADELLQAHGIWRNVMVDPLQSVVLNNSGHLGIYGSSRRWKEDIERVDPSTYEDGLLSLDVSSWTSTKAVARSQELAAWRAANPMAPIPEHLSDAHDTPPRQVGMIAEDVADAGLEPLVGRDEYGRPMTIIRENFGMMLVPIIRRLRDRVDALEAQIGATP